MSQTTANTKCPTPSIGVRFYPALYELSVQRVQEISITNDLVVALYGVLVVLSVQAIYTLIRKKQPAGIILSLTILALFTSTTVYMVVNNLYNQSIYLGSLLFSALDFWEYNPRPDSVLKQVSVDYTALYQGVATATVMINMILGDAIVWWRACVVWGGNRVVQVVCGLFLLATFVLGVLDATLGSRALFGPRVMIITVLATENPGALFEDNSFGITACVVSLTTNLVAILLIAYKAWRCRRRLSGYLTAKVGGSQIGKLFSILIESGAIYCALWVIVVVYQISSYNYSRSLGKGDDPEGHFLEIFGIIMNAALVPVIAIYPVTIIVLVESNNSHMKKGFGQNTQIIPQSSHPVVMADTVTASTEEGMLTSRSSVIHI